MDIITGYKGTAHISADQIRGQNQGIFGDGSYILNVGNKFNASIVSATSVKLEDGMLSHQGCTAVIAPGTIETLTIGNGTQGMKRIDLIVARYSKDAGTGVEDMELVVIQGTPAASSPSAPAYNEGLIADGDSPVDMPLFEVALDGISIDSVTQVASVLPSMNGLSFLTRGLIVREAAHGAFSVGTPADSYNLSAVGPVPLGYKFVCWIAAVSVGWVCPLYFEDPTYPNTNVWKPNTSYIVGGLGGSFKAYALFEPDRSKL